MDAHQLINQTSGDFEYYTDPKIIDAARRVMGWIDLDPASSAMANSRVGSEWFHTAETDGLLHDWHGRIWMNHPFGRRENPLWVGKLLKEYESGHIVHACCITFAATSEQWFQPLMRFPQCYLSPRTNYYLPDGSLKKGVTKGSVVTYMGPDVVRFAMEFQDMGEIKVSLRVAA